MGNLPSLRRKFLVESFMETRCLDSLPVRGTLELIGANVSNSLMTPATLLIYSGFYLKSKHFISKDSCWPAYIRYLARYFLISHKIFESTSNGNQATRLARDWQQTLEPQQHSLRSEVTNRQHAKSPKRVIPRLVPPAPRAHGPDVYRVARALASHCCVVKQPAAVPRVGTA